VLEANKPSLSNRDCGCSRPAPAALDGCGCKYGGASLSQSPVDLAWHIPAAIGSAAGAFIVWLLTKRKR
jgi:hypothetical protein